MTPEEKLPCTQNSLWGLNKSAQDTECIVVIARVGMKETEVHYAKGLPRVSMMSCKGGVNVTVEFFVPVEGNEEGPTINDFCDDPRTAAGMKGSFVKDDGDDDGEDDDDAQR
jgi:hypothetical protein